MLMKLAKIQKIECDSLLYDIETKNNHNFFANEILVHNSSCTVFADFKPDVAAGIYEVGVCSRNFRLKINEENKDNTFIKTVTDDGYLEHIHKLGQSIAIQGELCGPGIQGNKYKLERPCFYVFDVYLIEQQRYATREERWDVINCLLMAGVNVKQVPHLGTTKMPESVKGCLEMAEGKSKLNPKQEREGIVFKSSQVINGDIVSFKAISNKFLFESKE